MFIFKKISDIQDFLQKQGNKKIGFVPTMGALHAGHISLIGISKLHADITVASIFVNPTQFNDPKDLEKYPRTLEEDINLLNLNGCDVLFAPDVSEIYPSDYSFEKKLTFGTLTSVMEGKERPGHFEGVVEVVYRLLDIVQPSHLIMGQKDYQQFSIVKSMLTQLSLPITLIMGDTLRETSGLAMSSRNKRIAPDLLPLAPKIFQCVNDVRDYLETGDVAFAIEKGKSWLTNENFKLEYIEVVDGITLLPVINIEEHAVVVVCIACWLGDIRLIDNLVVKDESS